MIFLLAWVGRIILASILYLITYTIFWNSRRLWDHKTAHVDAVIALITAGALVFLPWSPNQLYIIAVMAGIVHGQHEAPPRVLPVVARRQH